MMQSCRRAYKVETQMYVANAVKAKQKQSDGGGVLCTYILTVATPLHVPLNRKSDKKNTYD